MLQWDALERTSVKRRSETHIPAEVLAEAVELLSVRLGASRVAGTSLDELMLSLVALCLFPVAVAPAGRADEASVLRLKRHVKGIIRSAIGAKR